MKTEQQFDTYAGVTTFHSDDQLCMENVWDNKFSRISPILIIFTSSGAESACFKSYESAGELSFRSFRCIHVSIYK